MQALIDLFGANSFIPHGYCLTWNPALLWTTVVSDATMVLGYGSYPIAVTYFVWKRKDLQYRWLYLAFFNGFILTCTATHLMSVVTVWHPAYWLAAYVKALSAVVSVATVFALWWVIPRALSLPSPAQFEVQRSTSLYTRSLIEASLDPLVVINPEGRITDVNHATEQVTGRNRNDLIGTDFSDYFTEPDKARDGYQQVLRKSLLTDYPLAIRHQNGRITDVLYNASQYRDEAGKVIGVIAAARDVTEHNKVETALREHAAIIESSDDAIVGKTLQGVITSWNDGAMRLFGYSREEMLGKNIMLLIPEPYQREEEKIMERIRNGDSVKHYETVRRCKNGKLIDISVTISPIRDKDGKITGASKVARDISERKKDEKLLRAASSYTRSLIEASLDPLVTISPEGKITDVNHATEQVTGRNRDDLIGTDFSDYFTEPDKARDGYQHVLREGAVTDYPLAIRHRDGHITDVLYNASLYRDEAGKAIGVFAAARDVTERNKAEEQLRRSARGLAEAQRVAHFGNWELDLVHNVLTWSDEIYRIFEIDQDKFGASYEAFLNAIHPDDRDMVNNAYTESVGNRMPYNIVHRLLMKDGRVKYVNETCETHYGDDGKPLRSIGTVHDITEQKVAEIALTALKDDLENRVIARTSELEDANKELESFSYSVSHDLRTPLRAIDGFTLMLLEDYENKLDDEGKRLLNVVRDNTKRMSQLIDDLLHFSRAGRTEMNLSEVDMEALAREVLDGLRPQIADRKLHINFGGLPKAMCDRAMMRQVIENLLSNAIKFTRKNEEARIDIGGRIEDGKAIYYVKDNGVGFDMRYVEKLFGVFQRLHGVDEFEGTGIGLAIVKRIITRHGGTVWAEGETGKGAAIYFSILVPVSMQT